MRLPYPPIVSGAVRVVRSVAGVLVTFLASVAMMLAAPAPASAHAVLVDTSPGNWQVLDDSPDRISLRFNEPVDVNLAEIKLISPRGEVVTGLPRPVHPEGQGDVIAVDIPTDLVNGTHTVSYRVTSADAHPAAGAFTFSVRQIGGTAGTESLTESDTDVPVAVIYGATRWFGFAGLAALIGTAFFIVACWQGGAARAGTRTLFWGGWGLLMISTVLNLLTYGPYVAGRSLGGIVDPSLLGSTLTSRLGVILLLRLVMLGAIAVAVRTVLRRGMLAGTRAEAAALEEAVHGPARPWMKGAVLGSGLLLALTWGLVNHSVSGQWVALTVAVDAVHLVAMGVWFGGLAALLGVLLRSGDVTAMRVAIPLFSRIALLCVGTLVVTGIYQAWRQVGTPSALFGTAYGTVLLAKLAGVAVLIGSGVLARRWVRRQYLFTISSVTDKRRARRAPQSGDVRRFRRLVGAEVAVAAVVLGVTASLVSVEPARAEADRAAASEAATRSGPITVAVPFEAGGRGRVAVSIAPGKIGKNEIHIVILDDAGAPLEVPEVRAELSLRTRSVGPIPVALTYLGAAHYAAADASLPMSGTWELAVTVRTSDVDQDTVRIPVGAA